MEIQKIFSDYYDDERIYSVLMSEEELALFSDLADYESHRGLGRAAFLGGIPGMVGGYAGKKEAEKLAREGKSDREVVIGSRNKAGQVGAKVGAIGMGAAGGLGAGLLARKIGKAGANYMEGKSKKAVAHNKALNKKINMIALGAGLAGAALGAGSGAAGGYFGGRAGANKNSRDRIAKKNLDEWK